MIFPYPPSVRHSSMTQPTGPCRSTGAFLLFLPIPLNSKRPGEKARPPQYPPPPLGVSNSSPNLCLPERRLGPRGSPWKRRDGALECFHPHAFPTSLRRMYEAPWYHMCCPARPQPAPTVVVWRRCSDAGANEASPFSFSGLGRA